MKIISWIFLGITVIYSIALVIIQINKRTQASFQQKHMESFQNGLSVGDYVLTMSGIYGYIHSIENKRVSVEIAKGIYVAMDKQSILGVLGSK